MTSGAGPVGVARMPRRRGTSAAPRAPSALSARTIATFVSILVAETASLLASEISFFAFTLWVYTACGASIAVLSAFSLAGSLPAVLVLPLAGHLIDSRGDARVMVWADCAAAAATLLTFAIMAIDASTRGGFDGGGAPAGTGGDNAGMCGNSSPLMLCSLMAATVVISACDAAQWPAFESFACRVLPKRYYDRANGASEAGQAIAELSAPIVATYIFALESTAPSIALPSSSSAPHTPPTEAARPRGNVDLLPVFAFDFSTLAAAIMVTVWTARKVGWGLKRGREHSPLSGASVRLDPDGVALGTLTIGAVPRVLRPRKYPSSAVTGVAKVATSTQVGMHGTERPSVVTSMVASATEGRRLYSSPRMQVLLAYVSLGCLLEALAANLMFPLVLEIADAATLGVLTTTVACGPLAGAALTTAFGTPSGAARGVFAAALGAVQGIALLVGAGMAPSATTLGVVGVVFYAAVSVQRACLQTDMQELLPAQGRGRGIAYRELWCAAMQPLAALAVVPVVTIGGVVVQAREYLAWPSLPGHLHAGSVDVHSGSGGARALLSAFQLVGAVALLSALWFAAALAGARSSSTKRKQKA